MQTTSFVSLRRAEYTRPLSSRNHALSLKFTSSVAEHTLGLLQRETTSVIPAETW